jgi:Clathrin light chain
LPRTSESHLARSSATLTDVVICRENEAAFQAQREKDLAEGTTWQRINKLLDLKDGQSKTIAKPPPGVSDTSRMREIYLSLAKEGANAPGAAGY